jgi:hypothetical protein
VCFDSIISNPLINGILLTKIVLKTALGDNIVSHGLGRNYIGYVVVNNNNAAVVYTSGTTNTLPGLNIILKTTADCTVSLFIF